MKQREHPTKIEPESKPARDELAEKAYAIYLKEGRPQGHADQNWLEAEAQLRHAGARTLPHRPGRHRPVSLISLTWRSLWT